MKILMLPSIYGGVSWWRFEIPAKMLKDSGIDIYCPTFKELEKQCQSDSGFVNWLQETAPKYDLIHTGYTGVLEAATTLFNIRDKYKIPIIVDIDDNLDHVPTYNSGWKSFRAGAVGNRIAKTQLQHADALTFSTIPLMESLSYIYPTAPKIVLENWIDVDSWDYSTQVGRNKETSIRLMITGGGGRYGDWQIFKEPLEWAMKKYDGKEGRPLLRLFFLGGTPDWVSPWLESKSNAYDNRCTYLQPCDEVLLFNQMVRYVSPDIILSPTQKNEFNRSKSGLKFLEASLAGAAFICTDFDTYSNAPNDCCIKVDNTFTQWQGAIGELIENVDLRRKLTDKAKSYVLDYCDAKDHISPRIEFYRSIVEGKVCQTSPPVELGQETTSVPGKP